MVEYNKRKEVHTRFDNAFIEMLELCEEGLMTYEYLTGILMLYCGFDPFTIEQYKRGEVGIKFVKTKRNKKK